MNSLFGIIGLGFGIYSLYAFYMLKFKKEINQTILLPKEARLKKCSDVEGYSRLIGKPLLFMGVVVTIYGGVDLYASYKQQQNPIFWLLFVLVWIALIWFITTLRKSNKKYFGV